jgi:hypothetical protein
MSEETELQEEELEKDPEPTGEVEEEAGQETVEAARKRTILDDLQEERHRRQELQSQLTGVQAQLDQLRQLREELVQRRSEKQDEEVKKQLEEDPVGYLSNRIQALEASQQNDMLQSQQWQNLEATRQQFLGYVADQVAEFTKTYPDYPQAIQHLIERRTNDYRLLGIPRSQWGKLVDQETEQLSISAVQQGKNPAEIAYQMAREWGFSGKGKDASKTSEALALAKTASRTLSGSGKPSDGGSLLNKIDQMSDKEFDDFWDKLSKENQKGI